MSTRGPKIGEFQDGKLWFTRKGSIVTLGVTLVGAEDIGTSTSVDLPDMEIDFQKGELVATVKGEQGAIEIIAPATGLVVEVNELLLSEPNLVAEDPTEAGWIVRLEIEDPADLAEYVVDED